MNDVPAFKGYNFGDEKIISDPFAEGASTLMVMYSESAKLESASLNEQRKLIAALIESLNDSYGLSKAKVTTHEIKVPGASYAVDLGVVKKLPPGVSEKGGYRQFQIRFLIAKKKLYKIMLADDVSEIIPESQINQFADSFKLLESALNSQKSALIDYNSAVGGFKARLPSQPAYTRRIEKDGSGIEHVQHRYLSENADSAVLISVTEFAGLSQKSDSELQTMCHALVRGMAGKYQLEQFTKIPSRDKASPQEWSFRHPAPEAGTKIQGRVLVANDRIFIVQAIGSLEYLNAASTSEILKSVTVLPRNSK